MIVSEGGHSPEAWVRAVWRLLLRIVIWVAVIAGAIYAVGRLRTMLMFLLVGAILAYIMRPMAGWIARRAMPRSWSMHTRRLLATIFVLVLIFVGGYFTIKFMVTPFVSEVNNVVKNWDDYKTRFDKYNQDFLAWYRTHVKQEWREKIEGQLNQGQGSDGIQKQAAAFAGDLGKRTGEAAHNIVEVVLLPVLAFYFALDSKKLKKEFVGALPPRRRRETLRMIHEFNEIMHSFVVGQAILCALAGLVVGIGLWLLGVKYPLTLGLLAGFTRAIPIIGPIIGGIPIILLALVTKGVPVALGVLAFFTFLHFAESKFIMPMLIGERMNLHPVVIIIVLLIGQEFGGLLGMFFAAPIAALIKAIVRRYYLDTYRHRRAIRPPGPPTVRIEEAGA